MALLGGGWHLWLVDDDADRPAMHDMFYTSLTGCSLVSLSALSLMTLQSKASELEFEVVVVVLLHHAHRKQV